MSAICKACGQSVKGDHNCSGFVVWDTRDQWRIDFIEWSREEPERQNSSCVAAFRFGAIWAANRLSAIHKEDYSDRSIFDELISEIDS